MILQALKQVRKGFIVMCTTLIGLSTTNLNAGEIPIQETPEALMLLTPSIPLLSSNTALQKDYLVVLLHGIGGDKESIEKLMPMLSDAYQQIHPGVSTSTLTDRLEFYIPTAPNNQWFKIPDVSDKAYCAKLLFLAKVMGQSITDKLVGFRESLITLNHEIDERLKQLNLGRDRLILGGVSQGAMVALTLGLESHQPVKAIVSAIGMWIPCDVKSYPSNIFLTNAGKDTLIPQIASSGAEDLLKSRLSKAKKTKLEIKLFPEDSHEVSLAQSISVLRFLDENVFDAQRMSMKFGHYDSISEGECSEEGSPEMLSSVFENFSFSEEEQNMMLNSFIQEWMPIMAGWAHLGEEKEQK